MKRITTNEDNDPSFDLPVENELLMLKLKAEFGAECTTGSHDIPPVVVNEFLKSVYEFEQKFREPRELIKIYDKIGRPEFRTAEELTEKQLSGELKRLQKQMHKHRLELDVLGEYSDRTIYKFITEEFFEHEMENLDMPGYIHHFCYEEFHPNHEMDIRNRAVEFLTQWFDRKINEYSWELADPLVHPDTREFPKSEILKKINHLFDAYTAFRNCSYKFEEISFEWNEDKERGRGYAGGTAKYDAVTENNETIRIEGPFQFYLSNTDNWWSIFYFIFPGFTWR
jgi:hypothetical protein